MDARDPYVLSQDPPDLILVDINLPGINGMVVLNELRRHRNWKTVPTVVLTSSSNQKELQACRALGAMECITKPATFKGYIAVIPRLRTYFAATPTHPESVSPKKAGDAGKRRTTNQGLRHPSEVTNKVLDDLAKPAEGTKHAAS